MKQITCLLFLFFLTTISYSQTEEDYSAIITKVSESFNKNDAKGIFDLFSTDFQSEMDMAAIEKLIATNFQKKGKMGDSTFLFEDESGKRYLVELDEGSMVLVIMLTDDKKISTFNLEEY